MTDSVSARVVATVAAERGVEPTDLPVLHDAVDTDALNALVASGRERGAACEVSFDYAGHEVTVRDGTVELAAPNVRSATD